MPRRAFGDRVGLIVGCLWEEQGEREGPVQSGEEQAWKNREKGQKGHWGAALAVPCLLTELSL